MLALRDWRIETADFLPADSLGEDEVPRWADPDTPLRISTITDPNGTTFRLRMDRSLAVDVSADGPILVRPTAQVQQRTIDHFLADQVIPRVLAHAGSFVFHAGAVRIDQTALVFLGPSGRGKSTLVASFDHAGTELIGDDAMILSEPDGIPHVRPVYRSLRLFPDSIDAVIPHASTAGPMAPYSTKERIDVNKDQDDVVTPIPVKALFSLALAPPDGREEIDVRRMSIAEACMALIESSFALDPADLGGAHARLGQASRLASAVPAFEIRYPRNYACLQAVRAAIVDHAEHQL